MQHDQDHDGHMDLFSHSTPEYSETKEHIDLKQFPSHYAATDHIDNKSFSASNSDITQQMSDCNKSIHLRSIQRSLKMNNRMFPKMRRRPFQCRYCSFTCPSATNLSIHMRIHTGEKPFKCGTCSYASARKQNLFRHITTVHKSDPVEASATLHNAYPFGVQSVDDGMPIVENVYGNVQDVVFVDGESVKVIGRDQGHYPSTDIAPNPHITQVYSCDSASSNAQQADVVEVSPVPNPTSATEFSTRHYADGSRFIFASGNVATNINSNIPQTTLTDPQFNPSNEIIPQQSQSSVLNNGAQQTSPPIPIQAKKADGPIQPTVYKEPITGAMKRKQGKSTTLRNILDSPMMLQNKNNSHPIITSSVSSLNPLDKISTGIKIIQSEEDLEDALEGRQKSFRVASSVISNKQQEFTPSPRSLSSSSLGDSGAYTFARESPDVEYTSEMSHKVRTPDTVPRQTHVIPTSQTRIFRSNQFPIMTSSLTRISKEKTVKNSQSEAVSLIKPTSKRPVISSVFSRKNVGPQSSEIQQQMQTQIYRQGPTQKRCNVSVYADKNVQERKCRPVVKSENDQNFRQERTRQMSHMRNGRGSLTVQVDLSKLICCVARKQLQAHLEECDVCEINLPYENEEKHFNYGRQHSSSGNRYSTEGHWAQEHDGSYPRQGDSSQNIQDQRYLDERQPFSPDGQQVGNSLSRPKQQVAPIDVDDLMEHSDCNQGNNRNTIHEPRSLNVSSGLVHRHKQVMKGSSKSGPFYSQRGPCSPSSHETIALAKTSVVRSSSVPISSPYVQPSASGISNDHSATQLKSKQSAEILAYMNAELQHGMKKQLRKCDLCGKVCHSKAQLRNHRRVHIETRQLFRCTVCRYCTVHYKYLKRHILEKHTSVSKKPSSTQSKICKESIMTSETTSRLETSQEDEGDGHSQDEVSAGPTGTGDEETRPAEHHQDAVTMETDDCNMIAAAESVTSQEGQEITSLIASSDDAESVRMVTMTVKQEL